MMDEEMGEGLKGGDFLSLEVDLDYEFDASKYFDFSREESFREAWEAQLWFQNAGSYPPSPFIATLNIGNDVLVENMNIQAQSNIVRAQLNIDSDHAFSAIVENCEVWTVQSSTNEDVTQEDKKFIKSQFTRGSTLMKPTASQLAKQNRLREAKRSQFHRLPRPSLQKSDRIAEDSYEHGYHSSKRQRIEGVHLWKVTGIKEHTDLLHKAPQKKSVLVDSNSHHTRLRITIPKEPELETAQRAQRLRSNDSKQSQEENASARPIFKARPLNRKILQAPSLPFLQKSTPRLPQFQPFHLMTDERALHHSATHSSSLAAKNPFSIPLVEAGVTGLRKLQCRPCGPSLLQNDERRQEGIGILQTKFKAQPLNKKILSSKGDVGVFRSIKQEPTKIMEFNFSTSKKCHQDPPTELFNKLSLNTGVHQTSAIQARLLRPSHEINKDWKENINCSIPQSHKNIHVKKQVLRRYGIKQIESEASAFPNFVAKTNRVRWGLGMGLQGRLTGDGG